MERIIITNEDREMYGGAIESAEIELAIAESDKFMALSVPIDLPRIPTIYDMRMDGNLSEDVRIVINELSDTYPKVSFENLTPAEVVDIQKDNVNSKGLSRKEIWKTIKPFFNSVFNLQLGDLLSKMTEIARRSDNNPDYTPTYEWLTVICKRILDARVDLFTYNIDLSAKRFNHIDNPIEYLLMLMKVQKEMYPKRNKKISETFLTKFKMLIQSHSELMVKLKMTGKQGDDFFGSKYGKVRDELRRLKGISYSSFGGKPLTVNQQESLINIIDDYKKTLDMIFTFSDSDKALFNEPLLRPNGDTKLASLEIYHTFDDSFVPINKSSNIGKNRFHDCHAVSCETINSIYLTGSYGRPMSNIYKNSISMPDLTNYIQQYFSFEKLDRHILRQKAINKNKTTVTVTQKIIIGMFFDVLDKYISND